MKGSVNSQVEPHDTVALVDQKQIMGLPMLSLVDGPDPRFTSCVSLGKLLHLPEPISSSLKAGIIVPNLLVQRSKGIINVYKTL